MDLVKFELSPIALAVPLLLRRLESGLGALDTAFGFGAIVSKCALISKKTVCRQVGVWDAAFMMYLQ